MTQDERYFDLVARLTQAVREVAERIARSAGQDFDCDRANKLSPTTIDEFARHLVGHGMNLWPDE